MNINELQNYFFTRHLITTDNTIYNNIKIVKAGETIVDDDSQSKSKKIEETLSQQVKITPNKNITIK